MASIVSVVVSDDIDGSPHAQTVTFGVDGVIYEIDLAENNRVKLVKDFAPFVGAARKVSQRRPHTAGVASLVPGSTGLRCGHGRESTGSTCRSAGGSVRRSCSGMKLRIEASTPALSLG
jgi:hypothetical protein